MGTDSSSSGFAESLEILADLYDFEDYTAAVEFLEQHPDLLPYLTGSAPHIEKHFPGAKRRISVEFDEDDEPGEDSVHRLYILIEAEPHLKTAQERMDRLDDEWGLDLCEDTNELVVIDLDYT